MKKQSASVFPKQLHGANYDKLARFEGSTVGGRQNVPTTLQKTQHFTMNSERTTLKEK